MATMEITPEVMISTANDIKSKLEEWDANVNKIYASYTQLQAMFEGEAATAFATRFEADRPKFDKLSQVMKEYQDAIIKMANSTKETDMLGKQIAQS